MLCLHMCCCCYCCCGCCPLQSYDGLVDTLEGKQHCYTFTKHLPNASLWSGRGEAGTGSGDATPGSGCSSLLRSALGEGEMALLGLEGMHANIARVIVHAVSKVRCSACGQQCALRARGQQCALRARGQQGALRAICLDWELWVADLARLGCGALNRRVQLCRLAHCCMLLALRQETALLMLLLCAFSLLIV